MLFLSTFATTPTPNGDDNLRHTKYKNIEEASVDPENPEVDCVQTNESAVRFLQAKLAKQGESIDKLYIIASKGVKKEADFFYNGKEMRVFHVELFKKRLEDTIGIQGEQFEYIDYDEDDPVDINMESLLDLADELRKSNGYQDNVKVHFDLTGGLRIATQMMTSLLYLLKHSKVNVGHVLYSDFTKNTADDMSELFDINTLVAGIEEFTNYGSTRSLHEYFKGHGTDGDVLSDSCRELLEAMNEFSMAVGLCIPYKMVKAVKLLQEKIAIFQQSTITSVKESTFKYIINTIETEYKALLQDVDNDGKLKLAIIHWCVEKDLLQQALTLGTEWLPSILFDENIYYHNDLQSIESALSVVSRQMKRSEKESFVMAYVGRQTDTSDRYTIKYKKQLNFRNPKIIIKFIRKNISQVTTKEDVSNLLEGLGITDSSLYKFIIRCVEAHELLRLIIKKKQEINPITRQKSKMVTYISDMDTFQNRFPDVNQYLSNIYKKQKNNPAIGSYEKFLIDHSHILGRFISNIFISIPENQMLEELLISMKDTGLQLHKSDEIADDRANKIVLFLDC